ncbi:MAG: amino acid permease [Pseudomonadota bacterium]
MSNMGDRRAIGFWGCWSLVVGSMIGSGVFTLPTVLAPYGLMSFFGWIVTSVGAVLVALCLARLAGRTLKSGGTYQYARTAFGDLVGFLVAWGYVVALIAAAAAIAVSFVGYLAVFIPALNDAPLLQAGAGVGLIALIVLNNMMGVAEARRLQVVLTLAKLGPLMAIIALSLVAGDPANTPDLNPKGTPAIPTMAAVALLTMWAFLGLEAGVIPAEDVENPTSTIPKALIAGVLTTALVYIAATAAVMLLVPAEELARSSSPFSDAAARLGGWGPTMIAAGALVATAGALNGVIFGAGQTAMATARDGLAPAIIGKRNKGHAPYVALGLVFIASTVLLATNFSKGFVDAFTFLLVMSTLTTLAPYLVSALAELKASWRSAPAWGAVALIAAIYSAFAIAGAGGEALVWGAVLVAFGVPVFYLGRARGGGSRYRDEA